MLSCPVMDRVLSPADSLTSRAHHLWGRAPSSEARGICLRLGCRLSREAVRGLEASPRPASGGRAIHEPVSLSSQFWLLLFSSTWSPTWQRAGLGQPHRKPAAPHHWVSAPSSAPRPRASPEPGLPQASRCQLTVANATGRGQGHLVPALKCGGTGTQLSLPSGNKTTARCGGGDGPGRSVELPEPCPPAPSCIRAQWAGEVPLRQPCVQCHARHHGEGDRAAAMKRPRSRHGRGRDSLRQPVGLGWGARAVGKQELGEGLSWDGPPHPAPGLPLTAHLRAKSCGGAQGRWVACA